MTAPPAVPAVPAVPGAPAVHDELAEAVLAELAEALRHVDAGAVRALAGGYGPRLDRPERRRRGAFATPPDLAAVLAVHALPGLAGADGPGRPDDGRPGRPVRRVLDPACGPGALLRAAFARLLALGATPAAALAALHGVDLDPVALALCRAVLALDALDAGLDAPLEAVLAGLRPRFVAGDALLGPVPGGPGAGGVRAGEPGGDGGLDWAGVFPAVLAVPGAPAEPVTGWRGGFDAIVLNPPWERLKVAGRDWSGRPPERLREERASAARSVREGGRHVLVGTGEVNAYLPFVETAWRLLAPSGRAAAVVPAGFVSDRSSSALLRALLAAGALESVDVLAADRAYFDGVSARVGAAVVVLRSGVQVSSPERAASVAIGVPGPDGDRAPLAWPVDAASVALVNPNTHTLPAFGSAAEARVVQGVHRRVPVLVRRGRDAQVLDDPWQLRLITPLHMTRDARWFSPAPGPGLVPLWEAKHAGLLDHRGGGTSGPRYWVPASLVAERFAGLTGRGWLAGYRNVTTVAAPRTLLPCALPVVGVGNSLPLVSAPRLPLLLAALASLPVDFLARCRHAGANLNFFKLEQVPVPPPSAYDVPAPWEPSVTVGRWVLDRFALAVAWTPALSALAAELRALGVAVPALDGPAAADVRVRAFAELDAAHAVLLGMTRADLELALSAFTELRTREQRATGTFTTATRVLTAYDTLT